MAHVIDKWKWIIVSAAVIAGLVFAVEATVASSPKPKVLVKVRSVGRYPHVGQLLHLPRQWQNPRHIQWLRCYARKPRFCYTIPRAHGRTYRIRQADVGHIIRASAIIQGNLAAISAATGTVGRPLPVNTSLPTISDTSTIGGSLSQPYVGDLLTGTNGTWQHVYQNHYTYRWLDCDINGANCTAILNATTTQYTIQDSDVGYTIEFEVTGYNY